MIFPLALNLAVVILAWGAIALTIASMSKRRAIATATAGFLAFAMFILDYVGRIWDAARDLSMVSPFHYYSPFPVIGGQPLPLGNIAALLSIFLAGSVIATVAYTRRDL